MGSSNLKNEEILPHMNREDMTLSEKASDRRVPCDPAAGRSLEQIHRDRQWMWGVRSGGGGCAIQWICSFSFAR